VVPISAEIVRIVDANLAYHAWGAGIPFVVEDGAVAIGFEMPDGGESASHLLWTIKPYFVAGQSRDTAGFGGSVSKVEDRAEPFERPSEQIGGDGGRGEHHQLERR